MVDSGQSLQQNSKATKQEKKFSVNIEEIIIKQEDYQVKPAVENPTVISHLYKPMKQERVT